MQKLQYQIVVLGIILAMCFMLDIAGNTEEKVIDLELTISVSKTNFHMCDSVPITVTLKNKSLTEPAEVMEISYLGKTVNFIITIIEENREFTPSNWWDVVPGGDRVIIEPNKQYETICDVSERARFGWLPGKYKIRATYPYESLRYLPWPQKEFVSNTIEITINPISEQEKKAYDEGEKLFLSVPRPKEKEMLKEYITKYPESPFINRIRAKWIYDLLRVEWLDEALECGAAIIESKNDMPPWLRYDVLGRMALIYEDKKDEPEKAIKLRKKQLDIPYNDSRTNRYLKEEIGKLEEKIKKKKNPKDSSEPSGKDDSQKNQKPK